MGAQADGLRNSEAFDETEELLGLAGRIADREPVDWAAELGRPERAGERPFLRALEAIDRLGAISGGVERELPPPAAPARERWGELELLGLLGKGSYGAVHVARDPQLDRLVALKIFRGVAGSERAKRDVLREGRLLARLKHPNVATVYGFDEREGELGLRMELVRGQTLAQRLAEQGPMGALEAALAGVEICRALAAAHAAGILHRDVKAQNVVREEGGRLVLVDFGLGLEHAAAAGARPSGTPLYLAPEIVAGRAASERSDLYALGVLLYHLVTGAYPVEAESRDELVDRLARGVRRPLRDRRPDLPQPFVEAVERALALRPEERFASAGEMEEALLAFLSGARGIGREARRSARIAGGAALGLFALAAAFVWRGQMTRDAPASPADLVPRRLTTGAGWEGEPAISPDGTLVAYVSSEAGSSDIWVVDSRGGSPLRLTEDDREDRWPAWLPDGSALVFESSRNGESSIWRVPRLGGPATFVLANASEPAVSPDGRSLVVAAVDEGGLTRIAVAPLDGSGSARPLTETSTGVSGHRSPAWSPDGRSIAFVDLANLWTVAVATGEIRKLTDEDGAEAPSWSPDGRWIYFNSNREATSAIWRLPAAGGRPERVSLGTASESHPRLDARGRRLVYGTTEDQVDLSVVDLRSGEVAARLEDNAWEMFPVFSPTATSIAFVRVKGRGEAHLWRAGFAAGALAAERPLVAGAAQVSNPSFAPDGRHIAYQRRSGSQRDIYVVPAEGGPESPLVATEEAEMLPSWSPTGSELSFIRQRQGRFELLRQRIDGARAVGAPEPLAELPGTPMAQAWAPDGRRLAVLVVDGRHATDLWIVDPAGAHPPSRRTQGGDLRRARWLDGSRLVASGTWGTRQVSLRSIDTDSGEVSPFEPGVRFGSTSMAGYGFDVSRDLRWLAYSHGEISGDVWVLEERSSSGS